MWVIEVKVECQLKGSYNFVLNGFTGTLEPGPICPDLHAVTSGNRCLWQRASGGFRIHVGWGDDLWSSSNMAVDDVRPRWRLPRDLGVPARRQNHGFSI